VRKYEGHVNRAQKVGLSVSPCAKYVAVGSEDKSVKKTILDFTRF